MFSDHIGIFSFFFFSVLERLVASQSRRAHTRSMVVAHVFQTSEDWRGHGMHSTMHKPEGGASVRGREKVDEDERHCAVMHCRSGQDVAVPCGTQLRRFHMHVSTEDQRHSGVGLNSRVDFTVRSITSPRGRKKWKERERH
jgi:hypothetical protein